MAFDIEQFKKAVYDRKKLLVGDMVVNVEFKREDNRLSKGQECLIDFMEKLISSYKYIVVACIADYYSCINCKKNSERCHIDVQELREKGTIALCSYDVNSHLFKKSAITFDENIVCNYSTDSNELKKKAEKINKNMKSEVKAIKKIDDLPFIQEIALHEFSHALDDMCQLSNEGDKSKQNVVLIDIYNNEGIKKEYSDIREFVAEAFAVSEVTNNNNLANMVRYLMLSKLQDIGVIDSLEINKVL